MTFIEALVQQGLVPQDQVGDILRVAAEKYEGNLEDSLIAHGVPENTLLAQKSTFYNIPSRPVDVKTVRGEILKYIPEDAALRYHFVPLAIEDGVLMVGITNPENAQAGDALQFVMDSHGGMPFKVFVISERVFKEILVNYHGMTGQVDQALSELDTEIAKVGDGNISVDDSTGYMTYTWEAGYENILTADELADQAAVQAKVAEISNKATGIIINISTDIGFNINIVNIII